MCTRMVGGTLLADDLDTPWYVKFIVQVGVPAAIACGLTFYLTTILSGDMKELRARAVAQAADNTAIIAQGKALIDILAAHELAQARQTNVLLAMCSNQAKNQEDRQRCFLYSGQGR